MNIDKYESVSLLSSKYALTITNENKDEPLSASLYTLTNTNKKADEFIKKKV